MPEHLETESLRALAAGELSPGDGDRLLAHLAECEDCFARFDPLLPDVRDEAAAASQLDPVTGDRIERRLLARVRRATSLQDVLAFGAGFLTVIHTLAQPLLGFLDGDEESEKKNERDRR